jgi:hypothetical protein
VYWPWKQLAVELKPRLPRKDWRCVKSLIAFPKTDALVLRNRTTREYVRGEALAAFNEEDEKKRSRSDYGCEHTHQTLADVLVTLVCWSTEGRRGPWAGCRFDIVRADVFQREQGGDDDDWEDLTLPAMEMFKQFVPIRFPYTDTNSIMSHAPSMTSVHSRA